MSINKNEVKEVIDKSEGLDRRMSGRQIQMYAIGGTVGTGIFLASGNVIHTAGPGGCSSSILDWGSNDVFNDVLSWRTYCSYASFGECTSICNRIY